MELILNEYIYDENITDKINLLIEDNLELFSKEKYYKLAVDYEVKHRTFYYSKYNKGENEKISKILYTKIHKIVDCFINYDIDIIVCSIFGEPTDKNRISFTINEILKESNYKIVNVFPELTKEEREKLDQEILQEIYNIFNNKNLD